MAIKLASERLTFPKEFSLQQTAKHSLAKKFWGEIVLRKVIESEKFSIAFSIKKLISHRKAVLDKVSREFSTYLPERLTSGVLHAVIELQEGYYKAIIWEKKYQYALTFTILNSLTAGSYAAGYFIAPGGHFNDLSWAKMFVTDTTQCVQKRFQLACLYCFEDEILDLWYSMKASGQLPCEGNLEHIKTEFGSLVGLWAYQLENKIYELIDENDNFVTSGVREAFKEFHEHASRFFLSSCSDSERRNLLENFDLFILFDAAKNNYSGFVYFIYSILPTEKKNRLLWSTVQREYEREILFVWACLLHSQFYETILKDILTSPYAFDSLMYIDLLNLFIYDLSDFQIPIHKALFDVLWNKLTKLEEDVLLESLPMIRKLAKVKAIDHLETIIQSLKKEKLLKEHSFVAIPPLFRFSNAGNYGAVLRYLLSFLVDRSHVNQKLRLRDDACKILDYITGEQRFKLCIEDCSESEKNGVMNVIENVQGSLQVLDQLLEKTDETRMLEQLLDFDLKLCS